MYAVRKKIDPYRRKHCFELFGYDFILDEDFNVWLIEVNTNPCIEESSNVLKILLPRMIEDMLRITVDRAFPRIKKVRGGNGVKKSSTIVSPSKIKNSKLTRHDLDKIPEEQSIDECQQQPTRESITTNNSRIHPVPGYPDNENMWEKLWNIERSEPP